jgi:hypothetical protein
VITAKPYEARRLPDLPESDEMKVAFSNLLTAVNGFPYTGSKSDAVYDALRWMRANPEHADVLLGRS